tara:strand:+ start:79 stop:294 length:216 start_codon:yes stop_codon:yes gene_type:complete
MTTTELKRKARIAWLNASITLLRYAMSREGGLTERWKRLARQQARFINERNRLYTPAEVSDIEKRRGCCER